METTGHKLQQSFFLTVFMGVFVLMFFIWRPFLSALVVAFTLAIIFRPIYDRILGNFKGKASLAAWVTVLIIVLIVLIPLIIIGGLLFNEVKDLYVHLSTQSGDTGVVSSLTESVQQSVSTFLPGVTVDISSFIQGLLQWTVGHLDSIFSEVLRLFITAFVMTIALFYILRDGHKLKKSFLNLSPLSDTYDQSILNRITAAINSVVKGSLIIAVIQGVLAGIGTSIAGLPSPIIWGALATIASMIPGLGTGLVIGPAIIYLFVTGQMMHAIVLLVWQTLVVGLVDNFLTPFLLNRGMKVHPFMILLSVLGGITFFGPIGFILGPIILALFFALLEIYPLVIKASKNELPEEPVASK